MKREDVLKLFPEATDAQIDEMLKQHNGEVQAVKRTAEQYKGSADEAKSLREQLEELQNKGLSDAEKMQKQIEAQEKTIAELKAQNQMAEINSYASSKGLAGDKVADILKALGGNVEAAKVAIDSIVGLKGEWESGAALAKEQEIAKGASNPGGQGSSGGSDDNKTEAMKFVEQHVIGGGVDNSKIISNYLGR